MTSHRIPPIYHKGAAIHECFLQNSSLPLGFPHPTPGQMEKLTLVIILGDSPAEVRQFINMINHGSASPDDPYFTMEMLEYCVEYFCEGRRYGLDVKAMPEPPGRCLTFLSLYEHFVVVFLSTGISEEARESTKIRAQRVLHVAEGRLDVACIVGSSDQEWRDLLGTIGSRSMLVDCDTSDWNSVARVFAEVVEQLHSQSLKEADDRGTAETQTLRWKKTSAVFECLNELAEAQ